MSLRKLSIGAVIVLLAYFALDCSDYHKTCLNIAIKGFAKDNPSKVSLGAYMVVDSKNVDIVLSFKDAALPDLISALQEKNPLIVAQSAYCLECLKAKQALPEIQKVRERFDRIPTPRTPSEEYAIERIDGYLRAVKNDFKD